MVDAYKWVEKHADYLYTYAFTRIDDEEQARDLVQETFLAALERVDKFEGRSTERTWLTAILKNKIVDVYRKKSSGLRQTDEEGAAARQQQEFFDAADGHWNSSHRPQLIEVEDPLTNKEFGRILQDCMRKLPALWSTVFTMRHLEDQATDTICAELKVTQSNFWVIIHRAKLNLRACLQKHWM